VDLVKKKSRKYLLETFIKHFPAVKERSSTSLIISGDNKQEEYPEVYFLFVVWAVTCLPFCFCKIANGSVDLPASRIFRSGSHFLRDSSLQSRRFLRNERLFNDRLLFFTK